MPVINVRGIDLFYREAGAGAPLLLIHGDAGLADVWSSVLEPLARDHRVIAYDRRGHTRSRAAFPPPAEYYSTHADDAAALLQALGAVPATVLGHSGGGLIALALASRHPTLVSRLILEEPPFLVHSNPTPDSAGIVQRVGQLTREGHAREAADAFLRYTGSYRTGGTAFDAYEPTLREALLRNAEALMAELLAGPVEEVSAERVRGITCPVTFLVGELTPEAIVAATDRLIQLLPQARVIRIPDAAHAIHIDQPELVVDAVRTAVASG